MDTESINSLLKYFPYTEGEKAQVRELLIKRDPALMEALNNFLKNKDVTVLNKEFKSILAQQGAGAGGYKTATYVSQSGPIYTSPNVSRSYETSTYTGPGSYSTSSTTYNYGGVSGGAAYGGGSAGGVSGGATYGGASAGGYSGGVSTGGVSGGVSTGGVSGGVSTGGVSGGVSGGYNYGASTYGGASAAGGYSQAQSQPQPQAQQFTSPAKAVTYQEDLKDEGSKTNLTDSVKRSKAEVAENIQRLKRMSEVAVRKKEPKPDLLKSIKFDFLPEEIKNNYLEADCKQKLIEMSKDLSFENFLDIRHFLRLDKIELLNFIDKAKKRVWELHPLKPEQDEATYNPGFTLEEFIKLLCGDAEIPKNKMGYIGLLFYYMDYNHNQILEIDEILQGFIMLGPGDKKDKIQAAFSALGGTSMCLTETQLSHYLEIVIRVYKLKEDLNDAEVGADLYDVQQAIDLAAKSLARKIMDLVNIVDAEKSGVISLEEFLVYFDKIDFKPVSFAELAKDGAFLNSLDLARQSKKKRLDQLRYATDLETQNSTKEKYKKDIVDNGLHTKQLDTLKKALKVDQCDVQNAVKVFESMKYTNALTAADFRNFFKKLYEEQGLKNSADEEKEIDREIVRFFQILDTNKNGVLEWDEMMSALIFVLHGSETEKARFAFKMFDTNEDNTLQFKELFYFLKGVFNLLMYDNPHELFKKETPDTIAFATVTECFKQFKKDPQKDSIDYQTFQKWYSSNL